MADPYDNSKIMKRVFIKLIIETIDLRYFKERLKSFQAIISS